MGLTDNANPIGLLPYIQPFLDLIASGRSIIIFIIDCQYQQWLNKCLNMFIINML